MKKILPLFFAAVLLFAGCAKEGDIYYEGLYTYVDYPSVEGESWRSADGYLYYDFFYNDIDEYLMTNSFVVVYSLQGDEDVALPINFVYGGTHVATMRYVVSEGKVRIILESQDGSYGDLRNYLRAEENPFYFKVCALR